MIGEKKGQLTIFVIVAVVLIGLIGIFFAFRENFSFANSDSSRISTFVQECIDDAGADVVYSVGYGGGYIIPPEISDEYGFPFYYYNGENHMPSKEIMETEMSNFIDDRILNCTNGFVNFNDLEVSGGTIKSTASILDSEVKFTVSYPLSIKKGESVSKIEDFRTSVPVRFGIVYGVVQEMMAEQMLHDGVCLSCANDLANENDLHIDMNDYGNESIIFSFRDENSKLNGETFEFVFINKY